ncbi:hypothetical protein BS78_04G211100 [Paspalum vaginatum]|nr:hypothetical protein BS78_04G211100 [Paspalum vaginatum]
MRSFRGTQGQKITRLSRTRRVFSAFSSRTRSTSAQQRIQTKVDRQSMDAQCLHAWPSIASVICQFHPPTCSICMGPPWLELSARGPISQHFSTGDELRGGRYVAGDLNNPAAVLAILVSSSQCFA